MSHMDRKTLVVVLYLFRELMLFLFNLLRKFFLMGISVFIPLRVICHKRLIEETHFLLTFCDLMNNFNINTLQDMLETLLYFVDLALCLFMILYYCVS